MENKSSLKKQLNNIKNKKKKKRGGIKENMYVEEK